MEPRPKCHVCRQQCVLGLVCTEMSRESKTRAQDNPDAACPCRIHYNCARLHFRAGEIKCPACASEWNKYALEPLVQP